MVSKKYLTIGLLEPFTQGQIYLVWKAAKYYEVLLSFVNKL